MAENTEETDSFLKKITNALENRLSSPFFGSFLIAWLILNWRIPLYIVFGGSAPRASYVAEYLHSAKYLELFAFPFCASLFFSLAVPVFESYYSIYRLWLARRQDEKRIEFEHHLEFVKRWNESPHELFKRVRGFNVVLGHRLNFLATVVKEPRIDEALDNVGVKSDFWDNLNEIRSELEKTEEALSLFPKPENGASVEHLFRGTITYRRELKEKVKSTGSKSFISSIFRK